MAHHPVNNENQRKYCRSQRQPVKHRRHPEKLHDAENRQKHSDNRTGNSPFPLIQRPLFLLSHFLGRYLFVKHFIFPFRHRLLQPLSGLPAVLLHIGEPAVQLLFFLLAGLLLLFDLLLQFLPFLFQRGQRFLHIQAAVVASLIICHIIAQFQGQRIPGSCLQLPYRYRIFVNIFTDPAQQHREISVCHRQHLPVCQTDQLLVFLPAGKIPGQPECLVPAGKFHSPLIPGGIFPGLIAAVHIIPRGTSAAALHSKQHTPDEGMDRGLSALVLSIDHIDSFLQFQRLAPEPSKVTETQFFQLHDFLLPTHFPRPTGSSGKFVNYCLAFSNASSP